jgi:3-deoxy-D-manno-octulosonic-acid transferase
MGVLVLWLYRILMTILVPLAIPVIALRDRVIGKKRPPWPDRLGRNLPEIDPGSLWIHAVSVGEVEVARRLIAELKRSGTPRPIVVTSTTATGLALARKNLSDVAMILASPIDLPGPVSRFFDSIRPSGLVLVETELWPEMVHQAGRRKTPVIVINARLSNRSHRRYRMIRRALSPLLAPVTLVLTRDLTDAERFSAIGIEAERIKVGGNVKYDLEPDQRPLEWDDTIDEIGGGRPVIIAASTLEGEEEKVLDALAASERSVLLILAPRHPERFDSVAHLVESRGLSLIRRSDLQGQAVGEVDVFLLDTIGELARAFRHGTMAFIGGSLIPAGGHNPLEPAVWGVPVLSGPSIENFEEIYREMVAAGAVILVENPEDLGTLINQWLSDPGAALQAGEAGRCVVEENRGATAGIAAEILERLGGRPMP